MFFQPCCCNWAFQCESFYTILRILLDVYLNLKRRWTNIHTYIYSCTLVYRFAHNSFSDALCLYAASFARLYIHDMTVGCPVHLHQPAACRRWEKDPTEMYEILLDFQIGSRCFSFQIFSFFFHFFPYLFVIIGLEKGKLEKNNKKNSK